MVTSGHAYMTRVYLEQTFFKYHIITASKNYINDINI